MKKLSQFELCRESYENSNKIEKNRKLIWKSENFDEGVTTCEREA